MLLKKDIVAISGCVLLLAIILAAAAFQGARYNSATECVYNLRRISGAYRVYVQEHGGWLTQITLAEGGTAELQNDPKAAAQHFSAFFKDSGPLGNLTCPSDMRQRVRAGATLANSNISYFLSLSASFAEEGFVLAGSRNISMRQEALIRLGALKSERWHNAYGMHSTNGYYCDVSGNVQKGTGLIQFPVNSSETNLIILP